MILAPIQLKKIDAARQSLEVTEAMAAISDDDVQLSAYEEQRIVGLFEAANAVKNIEAGYQTGCPYAAWILVKL